MVRVIEEALTAVTVVPEGRTGGTDLKQLVDCAAEFAAFAAGLASRGGESRRSRRGDSDSRAL